MNRKGSVRIMKSRKKNALVKLIASAAVICMTLVLLASCAASSEFNADKAITVISRENSSGTRSAFSELFGIIEKDSSGNKKDLTVATSDQTNSTGVMLTSVSQNKYAIGYVSLGSMNDTVKALAVDGVAATVENVKNGTYKVSRPFVIATKGELSEAAKDFIGFILSEQGQEIVANKGYISQGANTSYTNTGASGKVTVSGSSSVSPLMEKLIEEYRKINPNVTIELQENDSTTGINDVIRGSSDIGMASRELKDSEVAQGLNPTVIATDGIAVIVNKENPLNNITSAQVKSIYTGKTTKWSGIVG